MDHARVYAEATYGVPPEQVAGTAGATAFRYARDGAPLLIKEPKLMLNDNGAGKPEGIHFMVGRRPVAAFGNSTGDRGLLHDDREREYAYGPAQGLPATRVGTFTQSLYEEATAKHWIVVSMKNDWKRIFAFD